MKKKNKVLIIVIAILLLVAGVILHNYSVENGAARYLSKKYGWEISEIEMIEYKKGYIDYSLFPLDFYFIKYNPKWIYKYNDREFNVEYTNFHFADDYQLEDIFKWCTEYLQKKVDEEIAGIEISSDIIYHSSEKNYSYILPWHKKTPLNKNDSKTILDIIANNDILKVYYRTESISEYGDKTWYSYVNKYNEISGYYYYKPNKKFEKHFIKKEKIIKNKFPNSKLNVLLYDAGDFVRLPKPTLEYKYDSVISLEILLKNNTLNYIV